jgi:hypothetical protein
MKLLGTRRLSVLLVGTLLLCHGVFGALHLICYPPQCLGDAGHAAEHQATAGGTADGAHEHPADHETRHGTGDGYYAVVVLGLLGLLLGLLPKRAPSRIRLDVRRPVVLHLVAAVFRPPPTPTPSSLQVFRL